MERAERDIDALTTKHSQTITQLVICITQNTDLAVEMENRKEAGKVKELEEGVRDYIRQEQELNAHINAWRHIKRELQNLPPPGDLIDGIDEDTQVQEANLMTTFRSVLASEMKKLVNEKNVKQHKKWREFRQRVWAVHHAGEPLPEEDELLEEAGGVMIGSDDTVQTTCPITRQFLERPMKNKLCGHVYSHDAVQDYMKKGGATCPVAGCSKRVSARSLEPDIELERELVKIRKQKKTTRGTQADDVDLEL